MEDTNLMTVNKYVPPIPDGIDGTGYNSDTRQSIEPGFIDVMTNVDYDSDNFKFGLDYWSGTMDNEWSDPKYFFQDPLFPTIDIILDTAWSPLFITDSTATSLNNVGIRSTSYKNSLAKFLTDYVDIYSIKARQKIHDQFLKTLFTLFNTEFNQIDRNKSYYINSVAGLDKLTSRIVEFEKDKITITLNEDVSMISGYLAQLYNNLSYSYRDQRQMIPANLLRFNMYIKVHDVRNMYFSMPDGTGTTTSFDKSYTIYLLRDCTFDFKKSKNFDDTVTIGGFDAGAPTKPSTISFDVLYKSIEVESEFPLIMDSFDAGSTALKMNNKDKDIAGYVDASGPSNTWVLAAGLNTVFQNNYKSPDFFEEELLNNSTMNNDQQDAVINPITGFYSMSDNSAEENYKYGIVSSDIGTSKTREDDIKEISQKDLDKNGNEIDRKTSQNNRANKIEEPAYINTNAKGDVVYASDTDINRAEIIYNDPNYLNTDINGNVVYLDDTLNYIADNINTTGEGDYLYQPSVFDTDWNSSSDSNGGHVQTGGALEVWRDSIMGELNFNLAGFLFNLPFNIINQFFGGGGMVPTYIDTYTPTIPLLNGQIINGTILQEGGILTSGNTLENESIISSGITFSKIDLGTIDTSFDAKRTMSIIDLTPNDILPKRLDGDFLPFDIYPKDSLTATINTTTISHPSVSGVINTTIKPHFPVSGTIDTTADPHPPVSGTIDTTADPHPPVSGTIDTTADPHPPVSGTIDTTADPHPLVSGTIDTTADPHPPVSGVIDTTIKQHILDMGTLYTNSYDQRNIDLGLLYVGITNENILPLMYLYTGVNKYNDLANYMVFNNVITESKPLNNISIDLTAIERKPFDIVYEYNNNVDIKKILDNVSLYNNNIIKSNNLDIMNLQGTSPLKPEFNNIILYDNIGANKTLNTTYLTEKQVVVKTPDDRLYFNLEILRTSLNGQVMSADVETLPIVINLGNLVQTVPISVGEVKLGSLYEPSVIKKILEPQVLFELVTKKTLDTLGSVGNEFTGKKMNLIQEGEVLKPFNLIAEYDNKPIVNKSEDAGKEFESARVEEKAVHIKPFIEQYISEKLTRDKDLLNGDNIFTEVKKENDGLEGDKIR